MRILVTGGLGLVGRSVVALLLARGEQVRLFDTRAAIAKARGALAKSRSPSLEVVRGDLCNVADVGEAVRGVDAVIHLGAMIPPAADSHPRYASYVNEGGTANVVRALHDRAPQARLVFTSSIAVYGDRRRNPLIRVSDATAPGGHDGYARQKLAAERYVSTSDLPWVILRLTYIVSPQKLAMDPLMFSMPLDTRIEVCTVGDTARALANAAIVPGVTGRILNIAGGAECRTTYRDYLGSMTRLFGLGSRFLPDSAFSTADFHCGYMDTADSEALLHYQHETLADYYRSVSHQVRLKRSVLQAMPLLREVIRRRLLAHSPYFAPPTPLPQPSLRHRIIAFLHRRRVHS